MDPGTTMSTATSDNHAGKLKFLQSKLLEAAKAFEDPWKKYEIEKIPAERVKRHRYLPASGTWITDESIVKIESSPFDAGAMRNAYRMKKISQVLQNGHHNVWARLNWKKAPNYVAKCLKSDVDSNGLWNIKNRSSYFNDIKLQYEAHHWAEVFNKENPPKRIHVIQCYVIEFFDRPKCPILGCEHFVDGHDSQGKRFVKHNSNAGFVDGQEHRMTPQAFSAFSFYASQGNVMVVDIQGVGDLYTDPQIHSIDGRFGEADLGRRGMALFFATFIYNGVCDFLKLPRFTLSQREHARLKPLEHYYQYHPPGEQVAIDKIKEEVHLSDIELLSYDTQKKKELARHSVSPKSSTSKTSSTTTTTTATPTEACLVEVKEIIGKAYSKSIASLQQIDVVLSELDINIGHVHFEIALLEADGRFSCSNVAGSSNTSISAVVEPDVPSCIFHLCEACLLGHRQSSLALARLCEGLSSEVLPGATSFLPVDLETCLVFYRMASQQGSLLASVTVAGLFEARGQVDEAIAAYKRALQLMDDATVSKIPTGTETVASSVDQVILEEPCLVFTVGEEVEANYCGCGSWYSAHITAVMQQPSAAAVEYSIRYEDGSEETVEASNIRKLIGVAEVPDKAVHSTSSSLERSIEEELNDAKENTSTLFVIWDRDEVGVTVDRYAVLGSLARLLFTGGAEVAAAAEYYNQAAEEAMSAGKVALAVEFARLAETASNASN